MFSEIELPKRLWSRERGRGCLANNLVFPPFPDVFGTVPAVPLPIPLEFWLLPVCASFRGSSIVWCL